MKEENSLRRKEPTIEAAIQGSFGAPRSPHVFFENDINHKKMAKHLRNERRKKVEEEGQ